MSKGSKIILVILVVAAIVLAAVLIMANREDDTQPAVETNGQPTQQEQQPQQNGQQQQPQQETEQQAAATITYTDTGFSPAQVTVPAGSTVEVVNESAATLEFASDPHPAHTGNPELNVGGIAPGSSATFVVTETGTWGYHDHLNPGNTGQITVE